jgi:hypothetical protein
MAAKSSTDIHLSIETAEKVFRWRDVHQHDGKLVGKNQDKLGRWRIAPVPDYANDPLQVIFVEQRVKRLLLLERYLRELANVTKAKNVPIGWATPQQRCKAALKVLRKGMNLA